MMLGLLTAVGCGQVQTDEPDPRDTEASGNGHSGSESGGGGAPNGGIGGAVTGGSGGNGGLSGGTGASGGVSAGGAGGSGGAEISSGGVVGMGDACAEPGALACAGHHQTTTLICDGKNWIFASLCQIGEEACDTTDGATLGSCQPILDECQGREPGDSFCGSVPEVRTCGPDNVTIDVASCAHACHEGACDDRPNFCPNYDYYNCGTECGEVTTNRCVYSDGCLYVVSAIVGGPGDYVLPMRMPPTADACRTCENGRRYVNAYISSDGQKRKITTSGSWRIGSVTYPCETQGGDQCRILTNEDSDDVLFYSDEEDSEEREIVVEISDDVGLACP